MTVSYTHLHGTDTMAYTASALSFMLDGLNKPVVLTGSQIPLCEIRSDGRDNLITALLIAGEGIVRETCLYLSLIHIYARNFAVQRGGRADSGRAELCRL